jgi:hypothetical protein
MVIDDRATLIERYQAPFMNAFGGAARYTVGG